MSAAHLEKNGRAFCQLPEWQRHGTACSHATVVEAEAAVRYLDQRHDVQDVTVAPYPCPHELAERRAQP